MRPRRAMSGISYAENASDSEDDLFASDEEVQIVKRPRRAATGTSRIVGDSDDEAEEDNAMEVDASITEDVPKPKRTRSKRVAASVTTKEPIVDAETSGLVRRKSNKARTSTRQTKAKVAKKTKPERKHGERKSERQRDASSGVYAEASSDDEFAKENFMFGSDEEPESASEDEDASDEEEGDDEKVDYRVETILAVKALRAADWRAVCESMNTREVTRGSVWMQPDEEYLSESEELVKKYLIKWSHASYLHLSWETEKDLCEMANPAAKTMLNRYNTKKAPLQGDMFSDLRANELVPPSYLVIERILDVEDESVDVLSMPHETAKPFTDDATAEDDEDTVRLHGPDCFVVVKWEGLAYSDATFESIMDIRSARIDYETQMRQFYRREQRQPAKKGKRTDLSASFDAASIQSNVAPDFPGGVLRDYQWDGVKWLLFNWTQRRNSILADEMGLGKTIQASCFLQMLHRNFHQRGPFLIIAPLSTVVNWQREVTLWTDLDAVLYYGSQEDRKIAREHEFFYADREKSAGYKLEVVITTPETALAYDAKDSFRGGRELSKIHWDAVIIDEAHKCKNYDSKFTSVLREEYSYRSCLLLTGTPLQNNVDELWTLLNFVDRTEFADREAFNAKFGDLKSAKQLDALHAKLKPYLLRREKENVEKSVPPKQEILIEVELTSIQKQYYRAIYEQKTSFLFKKEAKDGPSLSNLAMELRKCCLHLFLIKGAEVELYEHFKGEPAVDVIIKASAKMTLLDKLLPKLKAEGHRVLIFSQFRIMLDIIEDYLDFKMHRYERVDGTITGKDRQKSIDKFANDENIFAMLLSTRAGGVGINLTQADTVIIFDSDWNPMADLQAQARAHRIGQLKPVTVYRFLTKDTYEQAMFRAASIKLGLEYAVMHNMKNQMAGISSDKTAENFSALSRRELENLLKYGAYGAFNDKAEQLSIGEEETIEQILGRSTVIKHEVNGKASIEDSNKASFAKASFISAVSNDSSNSVAIDDPDFWHKVVGLAVKEKDDDRSSKRKCRDMVGSYKEPSMVVKGTLIDGAYDSDDSSCEKKPKKGKGINEEAEWTEANVLKLFAAMVSKGYCNWDEIKKDCKLKWKISDIALGCRLCISALALSAICSGSSADADTEKKLQDCLEKHRAVRLALAAFGTQFVSPFMPDTVVVAASIPEEPLLAGAITFRDISAEAVALQGPLLVDNLLTVASAEADEAPVILLRDNVVNLALMESIKFPFEICEKEHEQKLAHLDDMLDILLVSTHYEPLAAPESTCEAMEICEEVIAQPAVDRFETVVGPFLQKYYSSGDLLGPLSWWNSSYDCTLLQAIPRHGIPDSKKRWAAIQEVLFPVEALANGQSIQDPKLILAHLKNLLGFIRGEAAKTAKAMPWVPAVLKALSKVGRPHELYEGINCAQDDSMRADRCKYLLSWQQCLNECGKFPSLDVPRLQLFVRELLDAPGKLLENEVVTKGLLVGVSIKSILECCSKMDSIYQLRVLVASRSDDVLAKELSTRVQQTGAAVPPYARDKSMPVWWTTAHDIKLLKLSIIHGWQNWKKIMIFGSQAIECGDGSKDELSILEAPADFAMPLKENGSEWVLALTPKTAEKRLGHILKAMDTFRAVKDLPQSPTREYATTTKAKVPTAKAAAKAVVKPAANSLWSSLSKPFVAPKSIIDITGAEIMTAVLPPINPRPVEPIVACPPLPVADVIAPTFTTPPEVQQITSVVETPQTPAFKVNFSTSDVDSVSNVSIDVGTPMVAATDDLLPPVEPCFEVAQSTPKVSFSDPVVSKTVILSDDHVVTKENAPVAAVASKEQKQVSTEVKKKAKMDPKASTKKPVPASASILSFFGKKAAQPAASASAEQVTVAPEQVAATASDNEVSIGNQENPTSVAEA